MAWEYRLHRLRSIRIDAPFNNRNADEKDEGYKLIDDLNACGADGWEIVFVWPDGTHVLMKRPKG